MRRYISLILIILFLISTAMIMQGTAAARSGVVYKIPVIREIDQGLFAFLKRGMSEAEQAGADYLILEIDTYGGLVDPAIRIRDLILDSPVPVVTFVNQRAWSAGALIALAGDHLIMNEGSSLGAAETRPREEKYISALRKEFTATAEKRGRNPEVAGAMVDADVEIEGLIDRDKLLTLTAGEALENNIADRVVENIAGVFQYMESSNPRLVEIEPTRTEVFARIVTRPAVSALLLTLGFVALIVEALIPGWGVGGTVGLLSLSLFFSGYMINDAAGWGLIILFIIGIFLILLELLVIPGFGVTGIGGIVAIVFSLFFVFPTTEVAVSVLAAVFLLTILSTAVLVKILGTSRFWRNISLGESQTADSGYVAHTDRQQLRGKQGVTLTPLRPSGIARIEGHRWDVVSDGGFLDQGQTIEVIEATGNRIMVRAVDRDPDD